jgi:hypothetical protein
LQANLDARQKRKAKRVLAEGYELEAKVEKRTKIQKIEYPFIFLNFPRRNFTLLFGTARLIEEG